ncbi:MAG: hypothetical protein EBS54_00300 [Betaproteobacteria bacterium]|nr:hypothetical protein [Betaproteobacteria bacterium]
MHLELGSTLLQGLAMILDRRSQGLAFRSTVGQIRLLHLSYSQFSWLEAFSQPLLRAPAQWTTQVLKQALQPLPPHSAFRLGAFVLIRLRSA